MALPRWQSESILRDATRPRRDPLIWAFDFLLTWGGRAIIFVVLCALAVVTLGAAWRLPFVMIGRWYWRDYLVWQWRREFRRALRTCSTERDALVAAEERMQERGLVEPAAGQWP
jgi:hypothetical protein